MGTDMLKSFGSEIRNLRMSKNLSQERLAEIAGVHRTYIGMIERGEKNISLANIAKIAKSLNIHIYEIFQRIECQEMN